MTDIDTQAVHRQTSAPPTAEVAEIGDMWITGAVKAATGTFTGTLTAGDLAVGAGLVEHVLKGTVARTDTAAKTLGTLPANAVITGITTYGATASDAGTTATLSVGKAGGTGAEYLNGLDVTSGGSGTGQHNPTGGVLGGVGASAVTVTGIYAETGTPSSTGGPWTVIIRFTTS